MAGIAGLALTIPTPPPRSLPPQESEVWHRARVLGRATARRLLQEPAEAQEVGLVTPWIVTPWLSVAFTPWFAFITQEPAEAREVGLENVRTRGAIRGGGP